ncbi:MAG: hypothetical protein VYD64_10810 [Pseudomonadota bacterium]|nr:hypothetical protein [Pseudomonadota bacterium]
MGELANQLMQLAAEISNEYRHKIHDLERQLGEVKLQQTQIEASLHQAKLSVDRNKSFDPEFGTELACPRCWIANERRVNLIPQPSGTDLDIFQCRECHFEFTK